MNRFPFPNHVACIEVIQQDILFRKIPECKYEELITAAWNWGESAAKALIKKESDIFYSLKKENFCVIRYEEDRVVGTLRCFAEIYPKIKTINLYKKAISQWAENNFMRYCLAEKLILSHEFFHYLEYAGYIPTAKCIYPVPTLTIRNRVLISTGIYAVSEIGAYAFSKVYFDNT